MNQKNILTVKQALAKIKSYCAYQERCHKEVREKLHSLGMYSTSIEHIMGILLEENFLNEERFSKSFARGKHNYNFWGRNRIKRELSFREISKYNINLALKEIENDYLKVFDKEARRKWKALPNASLQKRKKQWTDYFIRKGFEYDIIFNKLEELEHDIEF